MLTADAVKFFRGKSNLAVALGITPAAVSQWGLHVPRQRQFQLQVISGGELQAEMPSVDVRPKVAA